MAFENIAEKEENASNLVFSPFPTMLSTATKTTGKLGPFSPIIL